MDHANILYGAQPAASTPAPASAPASTPASPAAAALYGGTSATSASTSDTAKAPPASSTDAPARLSDVGDKPDPAAALYGAPEHNAPADPEERAAIEGTHGSSMRTIRSELVDRAGWDPESARRQGEAAGRLFYAQGISSTDAEFISEVAIAAEASPPTGEALNDWRAAAYDTLRTDWGDTAAQVLADARALVAADKQLHDYLDRTGLGNHPHVVRVVANRARQMRLQGKLT